MSRFTVRPTPQVFTGSGQGLQPVGFQSTEQVSQNSSATPPRVQAFTEESSASSQGAVFAENRTTTTPVSDSSAAGLPWQQPERGCLLRMLGTEVVGEIPFQYNPTDWSMDISINWTSGEYPNSFLPPTSFFSYGERTVKLDLFFASPVYGDVERRLAQLELAMAPNARYGRDAMYEAAPDSLQLCLKKQQPWPVAILSASIKRLQFNRHMDATRATASITFLLISNSPVDQRRYVQALRHKANPHG